MKLFETGMLTMTRAVLDSVNKDKELARFIIKSFVSYCGGDWGQMCEEDKESNDEAVRTGEDRIFAAYKNDKYKIWIITEWDRSVTTILFPEDY